VYDEASLPWAERQMQRMCARFAWALSDTPRPE
jgi:hypothetical protein